MQPNDQQPSADGNNDIPTGPTPPTTPVEETVASAEPESTITPESTPEVPSAETPTAEVVQPESAPVDGPVVTDPVVPSAASIGLPPTQPVSGSELAKKGVSKKVKLFAAIAGLVVILAGGTAGAYFGVIAPNKPQRIVQDSLTNTVDSQKTTSGKFEGEITCVSGDACKTFSTVLFKGASNDKSAFDVNIQVKTVITTVGLDLRSVGDKSLYLRLSGLEGLDKLIASYAGVEKAAGNESAALAAAYAPLVNQLNNQWYTIDESLLKQAGTDVSLSGSDSNLSAEDTKKIGDAYKKHQFITVTKKLANEKIHGQDSYHIQAAIDKTKLKAFVSEVKNANIKNLGLETLAQSDIDSIDKVDFSKYPLDLWVGKSDRKISQLATTISDKDNSVKIRLALYDYNKPVTVEKPAGAKSVMELISGLSGAGAGSDSVLGADSDNLTSLLGL